MSRMTPFDEQEIKIDNGETLFYRVKQGGNKNLVLLHGNMSSSQNWDVLMNRIESDFTVYALDMRGFGDSTYNKPVESIQDFSDDLKEWADKMQLEKFILAGWSLGGNVAMRFAIDHPRMVEKLILMSSGPMHGYPTPKRKLFGLIKTKEYLKTKEEIAKSVSFFEKLRTNESRRLLKLIFNKSFFTHAKPNEARYIKYQNAFFKQRNLADVNYALANFNISHEHNGVVEGSGEIDNLEARILVLHGNEDAVVPVDCAKAIEANLKDDNVDFKLYKEAGHALVLDKTDDVCETIFDFSIGKTRVT